MPLYEKLNKRSRERNNGELGILNNMINGSIAASSAAFVTTPMDVLKSKMMTDR